MGRCLTIALAQHGNKKNYKQTKGKNMKVKATKLKALEIYKNIHYHRFNESNDYALEFKFWIIQSFRKIACNQQDILLLCLNEIKDIVEKLNKYETAHKLLDGSGSFTVLKHIQIPAKRGGEEYIKYFYSLIELNTIKIDKLEECLKKEDEKDLVEIDLTKLNKKYLPNDINMDLLEWLIDLDLIIHEN